MSPKQGPAKKAKGRAAKKTKLSAKQRLAMKAAKKGVNKSIGAIRKHVREAGQISSETIGDRAQKIL